MCRALLLLLTALPLAACGGGGTLSLDPVARAADATQEVGSAHVSMDLTIQLPTAGQPLHLTGTGAVDLRNRAAAMDFDMTGLPASAQLGGPTLHMSMVFEGLDLYMKLPPSLAAQIPGGKPWLKLNLQEAGKQAGIDLSQLLQSGNMSQDPTQMLDYLRAASGEVTKVGNEQVRGVDTTHYRATLDLKKVPDAAPSGQRAALRKQIDQLIALTGTRTIPTEVWIDGDNLVRRVKLSYVFDQNGERGSTTVLEELYDFGAQVNVSPPTADEVVDITQLLQQGGGG